MSANQHDYPYEFRLHEGMWQRRKQGGEWKSLRVAAGEPRKVRVGSSRKGATRVREVPVTDWLWV